MAASSAPRFSVGDTVYRVVKGDVVGQVTGVVHRESYVEFLVTFADAECERTYQALELTPNRTFVEPSK